MKKYHISSLSKLTGFSLQTIRRYEKAGLLNVDYDDNGYRVYHAYDIAVLLRIKMYRSYGFSLDEILELFKKEGVSSIEMFQANQKRILENIKRLEKIYECGECQIQEMTRIQTDHIEIQCLEREAWLGLIYREQEEAVEEQALIQTLVKWNQYLPMVQPLYLVEQEDFILGVPQYSVGLCVKESYAEYFKLPTHISLRHFPKQTCLYLTIEAEGELNLVLDKSRAYILDYLKQHHYQMCGPILGSTIVSKIKEPQGVIHIQGIYIPIKEEKEQPILTTE